MMMAAPAGQDDLVEAAVGGDVLALPDHEGGDHRPLDQGGIGRHQTMMEGMIAATKVAVIRTIHPLLALIPGPSSVDGSGQETV